MAVKLEFENDKLYVTCSGADFQEQLESCRYLHMQFDGKLKKWFISPGKLNEVQNEFSQYGIQMSEYDKMELNNYIEKLSNFKKITKRSERRHYDVDCLKHPPKHDFQKTDIERAINQSSMLFKWDTGTGKSFALAGVLQSLRDLGECYRALILTSSIGIMNLNGELGKFIKNYDESRTLVISSISDIKDRAVFNDNYDIIICGYDTFKFINDHYDKVVNKRTKKVKYKKSSIPFSEWYGDKKGIVFMDECHLSGRHGSLRADCILMNEKFWDYRYLFSATPTDKEEKFYVTLRVLDNALVKGMAYNDWLSCYCELGNRFSRYAPNKSTWNHGKWNALQQTLSDTYIASRSKSLLNLPPAIDMDLIILNMSPEHRAVYEAFSYINLEMIKKRNDENKNGLVNELVNSFQVLQMAVENPETLIGSKIMDSIEKLEIDRKLIDNFTNALSKFDYKKHFSKLHALDNIIEYECKEMGNKIIIFYYHPKTLEYLKDKFGTDADYLATEVDDSERFKLVEEFKKSEKKILVASIMIANTSFTLTECKAAVFYERYWSGIIYEQARGRIHRIGQTEETRYYNLCYDNSIDNIQLEALKTKGACIENIGKKSSLTKDEWKLIFGGTVEELNAFVKSLK